MSSRSRSSSVSGSSLVDDDFCTPPVPGERHKFYGDAHNKFIWLPQLQGQPSASVTHTNESNAADSSTSASAQPRPSPQLTGTTAIADDDARRREQQRTLHSIASAGNLATFKQALQLLPDPLKAVNDPHPSTGLTPIHFAASRGHRAIVACLVEDYHVSVDSRDKEGETPLLKASYAGHFNVVQYLLSKNANIHQKDKDGWTALHNACSRGNLPVVRLLVERGAGKRINAQNKTGHTPLINAASKGHMSIVEYLLEETDADPLIKNTFREAAYDVSAASGEAGEAYICEMLERAGEKRWKQLQDKGEIPAGSMYDLNKFHVTVMVILHENQRSSSLLGLARPHFSAASLTRHDHRGPWSHHPSGISTSKETVKLPASSNSRGSNWFWLTDWQIDYSDPRVDPTSGWQYARSFEDDDQVWTPVTPTSGYGWVRRRRWVRVMKRRMDLDNGNVRGHADDGADLPRSIDADGELPKDYLEEAQELVQNARAESSDTTAAAAATADDDSTTQTLRQQTAELRVYEEAVQMLLAGIKTDTNEYRKHQATVEVTSYEAHIERLNAQVTALGSHISTSPIQHVQHNPELARELDFTFVNDSVNDLQATTATTIATPVHQPRREHTVNYMAGISPRIEPTAFDPNPWSRDSGNPELPVSSWVSLDRPQDQDTASLNNVDLVDDDFNEESLTTGHNDGADEQALPVFVWETDIHAKNCRRCGRGFGVFWRRHHCRRCGLIVCSSCSASRAYMSASEILQDPNGPKESVPALASQHQRVCDKCYADLGFNRA